MKLQKVTGTYSLPYLIEAEWTSFVVFSILFGPFFALAIFNVFKKPGIIFTDPMGVIIGSAPWILSMIWIASFRIIIKESGILYKTLFSGSRKEVLFSDIKKVEIKIGLGKEANRKTAYYRFNIYDNNKFSKDPLTINMKLFSQKDLAVIADAIALNAPTVQMDERTLKLKDGDFQPIVSEGIRKIWQIVLFIFGLFSCACYYACINKVDYIILPTTADNTV